MTTRKLSTLLTGWLVLASGPALPAQSPGTAPAATTRSDLGVITGRVIDQTTGEPLENARIVVAGTSLSASSERGGYFTLRSVPPGDHTLSVSYTGFDSASQRVQATAGRESNVRIELSSGPVSMEAFLVNFRRGEADEIMLRREDSPIQFQARRNQPQSVSQTSRRFDFGLRGSL